MNLDDVVDSLLSLTLRNDHPTIPNTAPIHPVLRNSIPVFQGLMTDFLPWLFEKGRKILLKDDVKKIYLEWDDISFTTPNSIPPVLCQLQQEGFTNTLNLRYSIYEEGSQKICYNTQIPIPIMCGLGETDPWGLKNISMRPYLLGGYTLTGKGMQKYPISIEHDRVYFGQSKKKMLSTDTPQFAFSVDKELIHPADKGQTPQHFKIVLDMRTFDIDISCNNRNPDLQLPSVNIIVLSAFLTGRTIDQVGDSLKYLDYSGEKTDSIHDIIDLMIQRANDIEPQFIAKIGDGKVLENLMSQYSVLSNNPGRRKGYMLELQIRRMLMALYAPSFYPDRDALQRKRYISSGKFFAHVFMSKMTDICNLQSSSRPMDKTKLTKEVERILSSIVSTINTDISTGMFDKKPGIWVHDSSTSTINSISKLTVCAKKLQKEITKDLGFRYYHTSQGGTFCPYDVPEHGENVGLVNSTTVLSRIVHIYPQQKLELAKQINDYVLEYARLNPSSGSEFLVLMDDFLIAKFNAEVVTKLYYQLRRDKRHNVFSSNNFGVVLDPYLNELRINIASGRLVQPILVVTDGVLELTNVPIDELINFISDVENNLEDFMKAYPDVLEFVDCDCLQVSSKRDGFISRTIKDFLSLSLPSRKKNDFCFLTEWGYLGWNINHIILRSHDEAIRSVFYCSLSKSGIHNKILTRNTFDSYHKSLYSELLLYTNPVLEATFMDRLAYAEIVWVALIPCMNGLNQEDGTVANRDSTEVGMLTSLRVIKYNFLVEKAARSTNTTRVIKHADQSKIDPVNGLPILGSYIVKGDAMVRNFEQISTSSTGITHKDNSEIYVEHTPARVERVILHPDNPSMVSVMMVTFNSLLNGDKISTIAAQKSTAVTVVERGNLPCTPDGMYPNLIMSPTGVLARKTLSMIVANSLFLHTIIDWSNKDYRERKDRIQVRMGTIESNFDWKKLTEQASNSFTEAKKRYDLWKNQSSDNLATSSMVMIHPHTNEVMKDIFFAPFHIYRSKHLANPKKNVCHKGKTNQETGQTTSKRKSGGASKFDEMSRNVVICYGAAYTLLELLSDPEDRKHMVYLCSNCGMFANFVSNEDESYYVCDICLRRYGVSSVFKLPLTYAARKFFEYPRARGIQIVLHPKQRKDVLYRYSTE